MNPQNDSSNTSSFAGQSSLHRDPNQGQQDFQQPQQQVQQQIPQQDAMQAQQGAQQQQFIPYAAFPATQQREYDPNIYTMIAELVDRKYGAELHPEARKFEIARVYAKIEIEVFEFSTGQLSPERQNELQQMTEAAQTSPNQQETVLKIREYMQSNVPNISEMVNQYMIGFRNQYMAGRY